MTRAHSFFSKAVRNAEILGIVLTHLIARTLLPRAAGVPATVAVAACPRSVDRTLLYNCSSLSCGSHEGRRSDRSSPTMLVTANRPTAARKNQQPVAAWTISLPSVKSE